MKQGGGIEANSLIANKGKELEKNVSITEISESKLYCKFSHPVQLIEIIVRKQSHNMNAKALICVIMDNCFLIV